MNGKGYCNDNSVVEKLFAALKTEPIWLRNWRRIVRSKLPKLKTATASTRREDDALPSAGNYQWPAKNRPVTMSMGQV